MASDRQRPRHASKRKRVLIVNCYLDDTREPIRRTHKVPMAMGPAYLAGAFSARRCEIRLYNEQCSGPLEDARLLGWSDMLVLTGLTTALDRMIHLTAYARTKNGRVIVVAGGPAVRALPRYCSQFFDYCCLGDVEEMGEVVAEAFGATYSAARIEPRYDLVYWQGRIGYAETSRNCNFRCSFCTLTAEDRSRQVYELEAIRRQILALGKRQYVVFLDNNFYDPNRQHFFEKLELLKDLWHAGCFKGWTALVTSDFFFEDENIQLAREAGCKAFFTGVESFDTEWLERVKKPQNARRSQVELIRKTLDAGIVFAYGLMLDLANRRVADLRDELEFVLSQPEIPLPSYVSLPIPMLGTPFFYECLERELILPNTRVRDLDGSTLSLRPLDSLEDVEDFILEAKTFHEYRSRVVRHTFQFARRYRRLFDKDQMMLVLANAAQLCNPALTGARGQWKKRRSRRTYISTTEILDGLYHPAFPVSSRYESYFAPTMLTDGGGRLADGVVEDLFGANHARRVDAVDQET